MMIFFPLEWVLSSSFEWMDRHNLWNTHGEIYAKTGGQWNRVAFDRQQFPYDLETRQWALDRVDMIT